jgi:hypothetical protein
MIKLKRVKCKEHVARIEEVINAQIIFSGKPKGDRSSGRSRNRWENNSKMKQVVRMMTGVM